jgi:hypothetical protein
MPGPGTEAGSGANRRYERIRDFDFFGAETTEPVDERTHRSFLPSDFGVQRGQFTFEGHDLQDYRGAIVRGQFTESAAEFFAGRPFRD